MPSNQTLKAPHPTSFDLSIKTTSMPDRWGAADDKLIEYPNPVQTAHLDFDPSYGDDYDHLRKRPKANWQAPSIPDSQ